MRATRSPLRRLSCRRWAKVHNKRSPAALHALQARLRDATRCMVHLEDGFALEYPGASIGLISVDGHCSIDTALQRADAAMYEDKQLRQATRGSPAVSQPHEGRDSMACLRALKP